MKIITGLLLAVLVLVAIFVTSCSLFNVSPTTSAVGDVNECSSLEGAAKDDCYFEAQKCSKIESIILRDSCVAELAEAKGDIKVCNLIQSAKTKAFCQEQLAIIDNDPEVCGKIEDTYWADNCHFSLAVSGNEEALCALISAEEQRISCYKKIALATNKYGLCDFLQGPSREGCVVAIAKATKDVEICGRLDGEFNQDVCRYRVAKESKDQSLCAEIKFKDVRQTCNDLFAKN